MQEGFTHLKVFIASPGDLPEREREIVRKTCESLNRTPILKENYLYLDRVGWETDVYPGIASDHPQAELSELAQNCDILVVIFHKKLGDSGQHSQSGTVDEIEAALKQNQGPGIAPKVFIYFRKVNEECLDEEFIALCEYKKQLHKRKIRTEDYKDAVQFQRRLSEAILVFVPRWLSSKGRCPATKLQNFEKSISEFPQPLFNWPQTIDGTWLERPELNNIFEKVMSAIEENSRSQSVSLLLGDPGTGKSAILARLSNKFKDKLMPVFSIKADMIPVNVKTQKDLADYLHLPFESEDCLRQMAMKVPVVLIIDQLDAVSEIADRKSERLNLLLNLIHAVSVIDGVHVVTSCRIFEHRHDSRLATIDAETFSLELAPWEEVSKVLINHGVKPETLSTEVKKLLQIPLHLKTFVEVLPNCGGRLNNANSVYDLYEELWKQKILNARNPETIIKLIKRLANWMSDEEDLWAPTIIADEFSQELAHLESENIVIREGMRIGFRHQTFFDFILARQFAEGGKSLSQYVLERQNGLFVRPILISVLDYLRSTSRKRYHKEIAVLWKKTELRAHINILLDEKIASLDDPDETEQNLVFSMLKDKISPDSRKARFLASMAGSSGWFEKIRSTYLPLILSASQEKAWPSLNVMISAWPFAHDHVFELMQTHLLPYPEKDMLSISILEKIDKWDEKAVKSLCHIARRTDHYSIEYLVEDISQNYPELALKVVKAVLERRIEGAIKEDEKIEPPPEKKNPSEEELVNQMMYERNRTLEKAFEARNDWYNLPDVAEEFPLSFLNEIWPLFINTLPKLAYDPNPLVNEYQSTSISLPRDEGEDSRREGGFMEAIYCAVIGLVKNDQEAFISFFNKNLENPFMLVHRLLAQSLFHIVEAKHGMVFNYLTEDSKRLGIGNYEDSFKESKMLINKVIPFLDQPSKEKLEQAVFSFRHYPKDKEEDSAKNRQDRSKWNRQNRLRLLRAFPKEHLSLKIKKILEEEERALPGTENWDSRISGFGTIGSPMSSAQMLKAEDDHIFKLFKELDDSTGRDHPRFRFGNVGGTIQASRELEEFTEQAPLKRVLNLIDRFIPEKQEIATGHAVMGLAKSSMASQDLFALIQQLDEKGFKSESFRTDITRALELRAKKGKGLPDSILLLLQEWLFSHPEPSLEKEQNKKKENKDEADSILFGYGKFVTLGGGRTNISDTVVRGYLLREPPDIEGWSKVISKMAESEKHINVWQITLHFLPHLFNWDREKATDIYDKIFINFPDICKSEEWVLQVARSLRFVSNIDTARKWLIGIKNRGWYRSSQAFGELILLWNCFYPSDDWGKKELEACLNNRKEEDFSRGIAFSASHLWSYSKYQRICSDVLQRLANTDDEVTQKAIASVCQYGEPLPLNESMKSIICVILQNNALLLKAAENMIEGIEPQTAIEPDLAYRVCKKVLEVGYEQINNMGSHFALLAEPLVRIALTLHRMDDYRDQGLKLFEQLMESNIGAARQALFLLDRQPVTKEAPLYRPRRRKRRRKIKG